MPCKVSVENNGGVGETAVGERNGGGWHSSWLVTTTVQFVRGRRTNQPSYNQKIDNTPTTIPRANCDSESKPIQRANCDSESKPIQRANCDSESKLRFGEQTAMPRHVQLRIAQDTCAARTRLSSKPEHVERQQRKGRVARIHTHSPVIAAAAYS
jgi:hypothetical protein